ncbi:helix-turn-helix domain-containing protein [uncultured Sharpea sp.]|uniref:helix-turn-helix domain-containing protein n=1 Tax=uncultured Sharpea sp. TaxID=1112738 RepID=UPI00258734A6|nr:helix-turn-helix domain-containing protein [uncultured Sharpea sp.]
MYDGSSAAFVSGEFRFFIDSMHGLSPEDYVITQDSTDSIISSIDIDLVRYPSCVHSGNLEWTDKSYVRSVINTAEDNAMPRKIRIAVIYCRRCSRYHALIPWGLIPFTSFTYFFLIRALYSYYIRNSENLMRTAEEFGIERSTLRRWKKRFEEEAGAVAAIHELSSRLSSTPESSRLRGSDLSALRDRKKEGYAMQAKLTIQERLKDLRVERG